MNSLSQVLLKISSPGVPDFYQGEELWDFNLVDPDNRRPVDFMTRARLLDELKAAEESDSSALLADLIDSWRDGRIKLYLTWKAARFRRQQKALFEQGGYLPLASAGMREGNVCAFARVAQMQWAICVAPRFFTRLVDPGQAPLGRDVWGSTSLLLPRGFPSIWKNVLTGGTGEGKDDQRQPRPPALGECDRELSGCVALREFRSPSTPAARDADA